jgi:hypothetical protein
MITEQFGTGAAPELAISSQSGGTVTSRITVNGTLQSDGVTLRLEKRLSLPPGPVSVTVQRTGAERGATMLEVLDQIHQDQQRRGRPAMTEEEMAAEIAEARAQDEESEKRWQQIWSTSSN